MILYLLIQYWVIFLFPVQPVADVLLINQTFQVVIHICYI